MTRFVLVTGDRISGWQTDDYATMIELQEVLDNRLERLPCSETMDIIVSEVTTLGGAAPKIVHTSKQAGQGV